MMRIQKAKSILIGAGVILLLFVALSYAAIRGGYAPMPAFLSKQPALPPTPASTRDGRWQQDVEYLRSQLPYLHVDPYFRVSENDFQSSVDQLAGDVSTLKDEQIIVEIMRIVASLGDGHTMTYPEAEPISFARLPMEMRWLDDELIVVSASPEYEQAVGARVMQIGGHTVEEVFAAIKPLVSADNDMQILNVTAHYMAMPAVLYGLNLIPQKDRVNFSFEAHDKASFDLELRPAHNNETSFVTIYEKAGVSRPLYEQDHASYYWYQYLPESKAIYIQYNRCDEQDGKPFEKLVGEVFHLIDQHEGTRLILDVRFNGGGNEAILNPFIEAIKERPSLNTDNKVFVIIGRGTFSSALQNAITLSQETRAILVGEPTGGKPNHYGEVRQFRLPNSGLLIQYSTRYWLNYPGQDPLSLSPDVPAEITIADLLAGRDPALEIALQP